MKKSIFYLAKIIGKEGETWIVVVSIVNDTWSFRREIKGHARNYYIIVHVDRIISTIYNGAMTNDKERDECNPKFQRQSRWNFFKNVKLSNRNSWEVSEMLLPVAPKV